LARIVFRRLVARDAAARVDVVLRPGASIESFRVHRNTGGAEVYSMEFVSEGRQLRCALVEFQARTQSVATPLSKSRAVVV
jgi:hypothetical protein